MACRVILTHHYGKASATHNTWITLEARELGPVVVQTENNRASFGRITNCLLPNLELAVIYSRSRRCYGLGGGLWKNLWFFLKIIPRELRAIESATMKR